MPFFTGMPSISGCEGLIFIADQQRPWVNPCYYHCTNLDYTS
jgi:hypothetical protein